MSFRIKLAIGKALNKTNIRTTLILGAMVIATLAGGAPSDFDW